MIKLKMYQSWFYYLFQGVKGSKWEAKNKIWQNNIRQLQLKFLLDKNQTMQPMKTRVTNNK